MLDHLVGRPSSNFKKTKVLLTLLFGLHFAVYGKTERLPNFIQKLNRKAGQAPWRVALGTWLIYYLAQNIFLLVGLSAPDPLVRLYKPSFYRATWILTALDAGFFTAMKVKPLWARHILSIAFSAYYLVFADAAEEKVRKTRATISVEQMRVSWEKGSFNPILEFFSSLGRPRLTMQDIIHVDRPHNTGRHHLEGTEIHRFYHEHPDHFPHHDTIILHFPGGGFVSMPPASHADSLCAWAKQSKLPIFSVNYKKAPEYPYPWAIEECFDIYVSIVQSKGKVVGLSGEKDIRVIIIGDSAGGNLTTSVTLKILTHNQQLNHTTSTAIAGGSQAMPELDLLPVPIGLVVIYPALDFEMSCWMSPSQLSLIRAESNTSLFRSKSLESLWESKDHLNHVSPLSVVPDLDKKLSLWRRALGIKPDMKKRMADRAHPIRDQIIPKEAWAASRLAMTSRMSFFNDRIITADLMRAMAIVYLGPFQTPDFERDYLLSPIKAPSELLAQFPKTFMMCGEKDPFVDDTVIFAGLIRQAKRQYRQEHPLDEDFPQGDHVRVKFLEGMSHAFLQMMAILPESHQAVRTIGAWLTELSHENPVRSKSASDDHVAEIITSEKDMIHRRKQNLVTGLY